LHLEEKGAGTAGADPTGQSIHSRLSIPKQLSITSKEDSERGTGIRVSQDRAASTPLAPPNAKDLGQQCKELHNFTVGVEQSAL